MSEDAARGEGASPARAGEAARQLIRRTRQVTRRKFPAEEKIRIVLEGIRGEVAVSELCRREGIHPTIYYKWLKDFMEAGKPGKMSSLQSSSSLVCNVFEYWRRRPLAPILRACGIEGSRNELRFEQKFPTGLGGTPPNLDVVLSCDEKSPVTAIESKFTEPYCPVDHTGGFGLVFPGQEALGGP